MKLIISEKTSTAQTIAHAVGAREKIYGEGKEYCYKGSEFYVVNARGHLYSLGLPQDYGYSKSYKLEELPIFPDFKIFPENESADDLRTLISRLMALDEVDEIGKAKYADIENRTVIKTEPYIAYQVGEILKDEKDIKYVGYIYENEANIAANKQDAKLISDVIEALRNSDIDRENLESTVKRKLKSFNGVAEGTAGNFFEYVKFPNPQGAYVFESAIDMMSFMHLHPNAQNCEFVSMGGLKPSVVETLLQRGLKVALCVDNDEKGKFFCESFGDRCMVFTECHKNGVKDFNELLQKLNPKKNFTDTVKRISEWSDRVQEKATAAKEALYESNKPLKAQFVR